MKKIAALLLFLGMSMTSNSASLSAGGLTISRLATGTVTTVSVTGAPNETCDYWGARFHFESESEAGKNMLSLLMAAYVSGKKVIIWYNSSTAPGTNQSTGCTRETMSTVFQVAFD